MSNLILSDASDLKIIRVVDPVPPEGWEPEYDEGTGYAYFTPAKGTGYRTYQFKLNSLLQGDLSNVKIQSMNVIEIFSLSFSPILSTRIYPASFNENDKLIFNITCDRAYQHPLGEEINVEYDRDETTSLLVLQIIYVNNSSENKHYIYHVLAHTEGYLEITRDKSTLTRAIINDGQDDLYLGNFSSTYFNPTALKLGPDGCNIVEDWVEYGEELLDVFTKETYFNSEKFPTKDECIILIEDGFLNDPSGDFINPTYPIPTFSIVKSHS